MDKKDQLIDKIVELEAAKKELESRKYLEDLFLFNTEILQVEDQGKLGKFHRDLCNIVMDKENNKKLILVPRGHLKSTLITVGYSLLRICQDPSIRILIANATYNMATAFLSQIKKHLTSNEKLKDYYGDLATESDKWSENMISVKRAKAFQRKEATVTAVGVDTAIVSQHYDIIIMDDIVNRDYINTQEQIEKTILFYKDALDLLEPNGMLIIIGTRWHDADLYGWILDKTNPERAYESFSTYINKAYSGNLETGENLEILWPDKFTKEILSNLKKEKGPYEFCLPGEAPILMSNFIEKQICSIRPDEEIIGFTKGTPEDRSKLVKSKVLKTTSFSDDVYEIKLESGRKVRCTKTHNWYTGKMDKTHKLYNQAKVGSKLMDVYPSGRDVGMDDWLKWNYLAGMIDGDGSAKSGGCLNITQGTGNIEVVNKIEEVLLDLRIPYTKKTRIMGEGIVEPVLTFHLLDNYNTSINLLRYGEPGKSGQIVKNLIKHGKRFIKNEDRILSIKKIGKQRVYGLETETGNYIAYGYASANSTQYMNDPIPQENADFKMEWFKQCLEDELKVRQLNFFTMVDPAISERKQGDKTAIVTIAVDEFNNWFVVNIIWDHLNPKELIDHIFWSSEQFHQKKIGIEMVAFQKSIRYAIHDEMRSRNFYLPVVELKAERSKEERIRGLVPRYANGAIYHLTQCPYREQLEDELMRFPRGKHDDIIDALAYALQIAFPAKKPNVNSTRYTDDEGKRKKYLY